MIKAIMGLKGTGKTKALADLCNQAVAADHGNVVYIEKGKTLMFTINSRARLVNIEDYEISDFDGIIETKKYTGSELMSDGLTIPLPDGEKAIILNIRTVK